MSSAVYLWKTFRAQAEQHSGASQKVFGFSPESVFAFIPECCSESARNPVRLHPGTLFGLPRNTHVSAHAATEEGDSKGWGQESPRPVDSCDP